MTFRTTRSKLLLRLFVSKGCPAAHLSFLYATKSYSNSSWSVNFLQKLPCRVFLSHYQELFFVLKWKRDWQHSAPTVVSFLSPLHLRKFPWNYFELFLNKVKLNSPWSFGKWFQDSKVRILIDFFITCLRKSKSPLYRHWPRFTL
jgi:hypothetical protein